MKTKFLQLHKNSFGAFPALHLLGLILLFAGSTPLVSGNPLPRFRILIDTNQMKNAEAPLIAPLAVDGVLAVTQNNCGLHCEEFGIPTGFSQTSPDFQVSLWPGVLSALNQAAFTITEDEAIHGPLINPPVQTLNNNDFVAVGSYIGRPANESFVFWEYFPLPFPKCPDPVNEACNNPIISPEEIANLAQSHMFNEHIVFLTRSFNGPVNDQTSDSYWVQQGLNSPYSSGVIFEINPDTIYNGDFNNVVDGLNDCLSRPGKGCYLLLAPNRNPSGTTQGLHYADDVQDAVEYLHGQGVPLNNPNLFVVLAVYGRAETFVGFATGDSNSGFNNSVLAAAQQLQTYRNSILPQPTIGFLDVVNSSVASGWTLDPQTFAGCAQAIAVHLYVDGNIFVADAAANMPRPDVNAATGFLGDHGFHVPIPTAYRDGQQHAWDAWAISASGVPTLLGNCPMTVTLPDNVAPSCKVTAPANNAHVRGTAVTVSGWAADNVAVTRAQFKIDGTNNLGPEFFNPPATFSTIWNTTLYPDGTHTLTVVVRDGANPPNITTSSARTVTVDNTAPTGVAITSPAQGAHVRGTAVTVTATASDINMHSVQFKRGVDNLGDPDTTPPYSVVWNTTSLPDGPYELTAVARDIAGNPTTSLVRNVTVDNTAPTGVMMTAPANGATVSGSVTLTATASGANLVQFQRDGVDLLPIDRTGPPYSISWNSTTVSDGPHMLRAVAFDYAGNSTMSFTIQVNVNNNN